MLCAFFREPRLSRIDLFFRSQRVFPGAAAPGPPRVTVDPFWLIFLLFVLIFSFFGKQIEKTIPNMSG